MSRRRDGPWSRSGPRATERGNRVGSGPEPAFGYPSGMCRSIKTLRRADEPATDEEIAAAALQFVRKVSGYRAPSARNREAFELAVAEVAASSRRLLDAVSAR